MRTWAGAWRLTGQMGCEGPFLSKCNETDKDGCDHFKGADLSTLPRSQRRCLRAGGYAALAQEMFANC